MKTLQKIEKGKTIWFIFFAIFSFLLLRLPSLIEPLWYSDEGIYEVIGTALNKGRFLYSQIWDNKPPLLYFIYALANSDQFTVRLFSLCAGAISIIVFYYLSHQLFLSNKIKAGATIAYIMLIATPFVEGNIANAENFMLLPIITAALLIYTISKNPDAANTHTKKIPILSLAGFLLGISFLLKTVAFFDFTAFFIFLLFIFLPEKFSIPKMLIFYTSGFLLPIAVTIVYFFTQGTLIDFLHATFFGNIAYVGVENYFLIPQGTLLIKIILLISAVFIIFQKRKTLPREIIFIYLWFLFSLFNSIFSGRPWTHYLLTIVPGASLMLGLLFARKAKYLKFYTHALLLLLVFFAIFSFQINLRSITKVFSYYQNFALFITNNKSLTSYQEFFDPNVPLNYEIAQFITTRTKPDDSIFIWGNSPQIYALADKIPPGKYTVEYHISQNPEAIKETINALKQTKPKYIIVLPDATTDLPFAINNYVNKFSMNNSKIYEITL